MFISFSVSRLLKKSVQHTPVYENSESNDFKNIKS